MTWFVYIRGMRGPCPQKVFDGIGDKPQLDSAIKDHVLWQRKLAEEEELLSLADLEKRYPAPAVPAEAP